MTNISTTKPNYNNNDTQIPEQIITQTPNLFENDEYVDDVLNDRIEKLESLVNKLNDTTKANYNNAQQIPQPIITQIQNLWTEDLLNLSNVELFESFETQTQTPMTTPISLLTHVSPFSTCEPGNFIVPYSSVFPPFTQHY